MTILYRSAYDEKGSNQIIDNVQSVIYNPRSCLFMINGKDNSFCCFPREEVRHLAIYDSVPDFWKEEGGQNDSNL